MDQPNRLGSLVWMILPQGNEDPAGPKVIWLTRPAEGSEDQSQAQSLLLAIECFCLNEVSAKPGGGIAIPYKELEVAQNVKRAELAADGNYETLINVYQGFLKDGLPFMINGNLEQQDELSLKVVANYYLQADIEQLRASQLARRLH